MKGICILGATGSIGISTLDVVSRHPEHYKVIALTANKNIDTLFEQCLKHRPSIVVIVDEDKCEAFRRLCASSPIKDMRILSGAQSLVEVVVLPEVDCIMAAIVGAAGLLPTLAAAKAGKMILLANKEALVMSGNIFMNAVHQANATLLPIDSEHNAIFQCMPASYQTGTQAVSVRRILLTASGGPFRNTPLHELSDVSPDQAVAHPNWNMGKKISVDSATMMNKGLEMIEACLLFNVEPTQVQIVIHPQSVIHSMVDYIDGTVLAQMGNPDMRIPIAHALAYPKRFESGAEPLNIFSIAHMDFQIPDFQRFPCLRLAYEAIQIGGIMPTILNAANEMAVDAFLCHKMRFTDIAIVIEKTMQAIPTDVANSLERILEADKEARVAAGAIIAKLSANT